MFSIVHNMRTCVRVVQGITVPEVFRFDIDLIDVSLSVKTYDMKRLQKKFITNMNLFNCATPLMCRKPVKERSSSLISSLIFEQLIKLG